VTRVILLTLILILTSGRGYCQNFPLQINKYYTLIPKHRMPRTSPRRSTRRRSNNGHRKSHSKRHSHRRRSTGGRMKHCPSQPPFVPFGVLPPCATVHSLGDPDCGWTQVCSARSMSPPYDCILGRWSKATPEKMSKYCGYPWQPTETYLTY
jgi:hypothetical protein